MRHLPNFITILNLLSGCLGIVMVFEGRLFWASAFIWIGAIFDFLDGFAARMLRQYSLIGKELDSLADVVTFGVLPACMVYAYLQIGTDQLYIAFLSFLLVGASAYRLAKFNVDDRQKDAFLGLPTPASGIFFSAFPFIEHFHPVLFTTISQPTVLLGITIVISLLLISEFPMFSLKFKSFTWKDNQLKYLFIITSVVLIATIHFLAIPTIIFLYVFLSLITRIKSDQSE